MNDLNKFSLPAGLNAPPTISRPTGIYQVPTDFVELPSMGKFYPKDSVLYNVTELEVKYMTAKEEDILVTPGLIKAGIAIDRVIESLLIDKRIKASDLLIGDRTAILVNARKNAFGDEYEFSYNCSQCGQINKHKEYFSNIKIKPIEQNEFYDLENGFLKIKLPNSGDVLTLKLLRGIDERLIEQTIKKREENKLHPENLLTRYRHMIVAVNDDFRTETIASFIENGGLGYVDSFYLRLRYAQLSPNISFTFHSVCKNEECRYEENGDVPIVANFFRPQL